MADETFGHFHPLAPAVHLGEFAEAEEHGQRWLSCVACGAQWAIVATSAGDSIEQVSDGDGFCESITRCSVCGDPAHASETDDDDRCEECRQ
jgi:hypothetical protein